MYLLSTHMQVNGDSHNAVLRIAVPGYPKVQCDRVQCPEPYMGLGVQPGAPPDPTLPAQEPFGAGKERVCIEGLNSELRHVWCGHGVRQCRSLGLTASDIPSVH